MWVGKSSILVLQQIDSACFYGPDNRYWTKYRLTYIKFSLNATLKTAPAETNNDSVFHKKKHVEIQVDALLILRTVPYNKMKKRERQNSKFAMMRTVHVSTRNYYKISKLHNYKINIYTWQTARCTVVSADASQPYG
jgi:hypothetical protein